MTFCSICCVDIIEGDNCVPLLFLFYLLFSFHYNIFMAIYRHICWFYLIHLENTFTLYFPSTDIYISLSLSFFPFIYLSIYLSYEFFLRLPCDKFSLGLNKHKYNLFWLFSIFSPQLIFSCIAKGNVENNRAKRGKNDQAC